MAKIVKLYELDKDTFEVKTLTITESQYIDTHTNLLYFADRDTASRYAAWIKANKDGKKKSTVFNTFQSKEYQYSSEG